MTGFRLDEPKAAGANRSVTRDCQVCSGDGMVLVSTRKPQQTQWMRQRGIEPSEHMFEEYAPCPSCNADADSGFRRFDGSYARRMDPGKTWELMAG